jgi:hypothetical protein
MATSNRLKALVEKLSRIQALTEAELGRVSGGDGDCSDADVSDLYNATDLPLPPSDWGNAYPDSSNDSPAIADCSDV